MGKKFLGVALILSLVFAMMQTGIMSVAAPTPAPTPASVNSQGKTVEEQLLDYYNALAVQETAKGHKKAAEEAKKKAEEYAAIVNSQKKGSNIPGQTLQTPKKSVLDVATTYYDAGNGWSQSSDGNTFKHNKTGEIYYSYKGLTTDYPEFGRFVYTGDTCKVMVTACCERLSRYSILTYDQACEKMKSEGYVLRSADKKLLIQWVDPGVTHVRFTHNAMTCIFERDYSMAQLSTPSEYYGTNYGVTPTPSATPYPVDATPSTDPTATPYPTGYVTPTPSATPTSTPYQVEDAEKYRVN
ncbi:MAG: hypothetical protein K6A38_06575 [Lachnospiraceae bacterium]|nr:hypothetical protein [Lachnospiraceae bacterium]